MNTVTLTDEQRDHLVWLGLIYLLNKERDAVADAAVAEIKKDKKRQAKPKVKAKKAGRKWTPEQRAKFNKTMKKIWKQKRSNVEPTK